MKTSAWPSIDELKLAYERLQSKSNLKSGDGVTIDNLVRWAPWSRVDARLAEILIRTLAKRFREIDAFSLRDKNSNCSQPQTLAVLFEFSRLLLANAEAKERADFRSWSSIVTKNLRPAPPQVFSIGSVNVNPERLLRKFELSLDAYRRWGYFGDESLVPGKDLPTASITLLGREARLMILDELIKIKRLNSSPHSREFTVNDYMTACRGQVHRRTAERDLKQHSEIKQIGFTQKCRYRVQ